MRPKEFRYRHFILTMLLNLRKEYAGMQDSQVDHCELMKPILKPLTLCYPISEI